MPHILRWSLAAFLLGSAGAADAQDITQRRHAILVAEDLRPATAAGLAPIRAGLLSSDTVAQRLAVRALGRLERPELVPEILPSLTEPAASVRAEAINALGQAVVRGGADSVRRALEDRAGLENDPMVRGVLFRTLGRLRLEANPDGLERLLVQASRSAAGDAPPEVLEGVAHGLGSFYRRTAASRPPAVDALERLVELTRGRHPAAVRRLAMAAFVASGRTDSGALLDGLADPEWEVRRLVAVAAGSQAELPGRERILRRALQDTTPQVRLEALKAWGRRAVGSGGCMPLVQAVRDGDAHVQLMAIDLLPACGPAVTGTLQSIVEEPVTAPAWHRPAHAIVALARVAPELARGVLPTLGNASTWWARMYAAEAAGIAADTAALVRLARDTHPNVREAALRGLVTRLGHAADSLYLAALDARDEQLVKTAAGALLGTPDTVWAVPALRRTLARLVREGKETSIDARQAVAAALVSLGAAGPVRSMATRPAGAVPRWETLEQLAGTRAVITMADGGRIVLALFPTEAPTNVARFVRMVRQGWFTGLTFHRVVPNFVVQGGSPGANEYVGDGPFTRDELGLRSHRRGTVGLSTRGRDTGDGQVFINLVGNERLDHDYTLWGEVIEGMDVVDGLLEGAVIARVTLEPAR